MTHVLACALCSNGTQAPTSPATVVMYLAIGAVVAVFFAVNAKRRKAGKPPLSSPVARMSPGARSLLSGYNVPAYTAPVRAVTPSGIAVRQARCCAAAHQTPDQAVTHAAQIAARIGRHGR
jgi:acyl-CoA synthetase (NDP forming)